ncbi:hypothetical protein F5Y01DRAFT_299591 [Xylaria sp. FL0043]|nr:hypothetical protein F5Y01DRAFT_299591 [Xylaria sp. FL0043]
MNLSHCLFLVLNSQSLLSWYNYLLLLQMFCIPTLNDRTGMLKYYLILNLNLECVPDFGNFNVSQQIIYHKD